MPSFESALSNEGTVISNPTWSVEETSQEARHGERKAVALEIGSSNWPSVLWTFYVSREARVFKIESMGEEEGDSQAPE